MDWKLFAQLAATGLVTVLGWWVVNFFSKRRDIENDRRKLQTEYLLEAYRRLEGASHREGRQKEFEGQLESAIADIQLLGTAKQVDLALEFATDMADNAATAARFKLPMPVLALGGDRSWGRGMEVVESLQRLAVDVQGGVVENCGHWMPEEQPADLLRRLLAFFGPSDPAQK